MARADTITLLSLDQYAEIMGIDPWNFNQIGVNIPSWIEFQCEAVWFQQSWQQDFLSREELARCISTAEEWLSSYLDFFPAPRYTVNEIHKYPRPYKVEGYGRMGTPRGQWKPIQTDHTHVIQPGILARTQISAGAAVAFSDEDGDAIDETFTIGPIATTVTEESEIGIYFNSTDRLGKAISEAWRIRPVTVTISGGNVTIVGHTAQLVLPNLTLVVKPDSLDGTDATNFAATVSVYRVYTDTTHDDTNMNQGVAVWETPPGCATCSLETASICVVDNDADEGRVKVQPDSWPYNREPDFVKLNYLSGIPLLNDRVQSPYDKMIAYLATALLPSEKCGCERSNHILRYWRMYPSEDITSSNRPLTIREIDDNPFGPRRGARFAWRMLSQFRTTGVIAI